MDENPPLSLASRAVARLRNLAQGNGLEPSAIAILDVKEQQLSMGGIMEISPYCAAEPVAIPGSVKEGAVQKFATFAELTAAVAAYQKTFREARDWIPEVVQEIKKHDSQGFGLSDAKVVLSEKTALFLAQEFCKTCHGQKLVACAVCNGRGEMTCTQCNGQGREFCTYCNGRGENPFQPGQRCPTCNGTRLMPCRFCHARGIIICSNCHGKRGTPCPACNGAGSTMQEVMVTCGAETHFRLVSSDLPSGLRRGVERIGINNLGKGHGDITTTKPTEEQIEEKRNGQRIPVLNYAVALPYAEMRIAFGNKKAVVSAVGKKCAISGVPNFLDDTLQPWREKLHAAATGMGSLQDAAEARALSEILALCVSGKGSGSEVRKLYPFGLSADVIMAVLKDMRLAINRVTLKTRVIIAVLCPVVSAVVFYIALVWGYLTAMTLSMQPWQQCAADLGLLAAVMGISWAILNFTTHFVMKRRFPTLTHSKQQKIGKTGSAMLGAIAALFVVALWVTPLKPLWLAMPFYQTYTMPQQVRHN